MDEYKNGNINGESRADGTGQERKVLSALKSAPHVYFLLSMCTRAPYVLCDPETFDDEILVFLDREEARAESERFSEQKIPVQVARVEGEHLLAFYTSLYTMGINALLTEASREREVIQLEENLQRRTPDSLPEGKVWIENPALYLTSLYYMQELRRQPNLENTPQLQRLQEEITVHLKRGSYILGVEKETSRVPLMKLGADTVYQPFFTDALEFQKFNKEDKLRPLVIPFDKIMKALAPQAKGMLLNPMSINMPLALSQKDPAGKQGEAFEAQ